MADYNLKIIDNKVIFDGHAENSSDCHTLTLLCNLLQKNTKTVDYRTGYAEFELEDIPSENRFWLSDTQTFYINDILVEVAATQATVDAFIVGASLDISLSFSQDGVTVHNIGTIACKVKLVSDLDLDSYFSVTSISSISAGETALLPFLDNIKLRSILSSDGQEISEGDVISEDGTKLTVSKIKSIDLTTLPGWSSLSPGTHNITIVAKAAGYIDSEKSAGVEVTKSASPKTLEESTWAEIAQVSANKSWNAMGWQVGDSKTITLNGTVGTLALNNYQCKVYIIGFDHNAEKEGQGISFGLLEGVDGKQLCLVDQYYGGEKTSEAMAFSMNTTDTNAGGWKASKMRKTILGSTDVENGDATPDTIASPAANTLMAALPADLRAVLKPITKYTNNVGNSEEASAISPSIDYLPLMTSFEGVGAVPGINQNEFDYQTRYEFYKNMSKNIRYKHDADAAAAYWFRSPSSLPSNGFCAVRVDGQGMGGAASKSLGLAPVFLV